MKMIQFFFVLCLLFGSLVYAFDQVGPYLQRVTDQSVVIRWTSASAMSECVSYGETSIQEHQICDEGGAVQHRIQIQGLKPDTRYVYAVSSEATKHDFKTFPNSERPLRFVVWGDSQGNPDVLSTHIQHMMERQPDLALTVGDMVQDPNVDNAWENEFFKPASPLVSSTPFYLAFGNHDSKNAPLLDSFFEQPGDNHHFAFTYGLARFVVLDFHPKAGGSYLHRYSWLRHELNSSAYQKAKYHFVFIHEPPYAENWDGHFYNGTWLERVLMTSLFRKHDVDIVFSGHVHGYERGTRKGVSYVITGGGGGGLDETNWTHWPFMEQNIVAHHFTSVDVGEDKVSVSAIGVDGAVLDYFEIH